MIPVEDEALLETVLVIVVVVVEVVVPRVCAGGGDCVTFLGVEGPLVFWGVVIDRVGLMTGFVVVVVTVSS